MQALVTSLFTLLLALAPLAQVCANSSAQVQQNTVQPAHLRAIYGPPPLFGLNSLWSGMQLAQLTPTLGQYFGTEQGLLVVHAPRDPAFKLEDGDVILKIGGRDPGTPSHAMRILYSYAVGEKLTLDILRKHKSMTLSIIVPKAHKPGLGPYQPMSLQDSGVYRPLGGSGIGVRKS